MINIGIVGGAGYTAGELLRILLRHPDAHIQSVHSSSQSGKPVTDIHTDLLGETDLTFNSEIDPGVDVLFLCMGHGKSKEFLDQHTIPSAVRIIDLSQDFRVDKHPEREFIYGLPELNRPRIKDAENIANPGCFATTIQLGLLPLLQAQTVSNDVQITGITGSTGAGQQPRETTHFSWREGNISVYKPFSHQHLREINQTVHQCHPKYNGALNFIPVRGNFTRGILAIMHTKTPMQESKVISLYQDYYNDHPFVYVSKKNPDLKQVVNTNKCVIHLEKHGENLMILSMLDNLVKGASGQAVQNMNLLTGLDETTGLHLKASVF